jgi:acyl-coenzyme A thioesterase PaaI-like protein
MSPLPTPSPAGRFHDSSSSPAVGTMARWMPFDMVIGSCNPVAPPISIEFEARKAIGTVTFGPLYEGAPGCMHGAALAGAFDLMLAAGCVLANVAGPTAELAIRFLEPTLLSRPLVIETWVTNSVGRRVHSEGRLVQDGIVTVEAMGQFVDIGRDRVATMHRRGDERSHHDASDGDDASPT